MEERNGVKGDFQFNDMREREIAKEYTEKSKAPGDHNWKKAHMITGLGDYTEADWGTERSSE